jgi:hypothetical protein
MVEPNADTGAFAGPWIARLLAAVEANADEAIKTRVFEACSAGCSEYWAARAREVRAHASSANDEAALLARFEEILPGGKGSGGPVSDGETITWRLSGPAGSALPQS